MNKRAIYLLIGTALLLVVFVLVLIAQQPAQPTKSVSVVKPTAAQESGTSNTKYTQNTPANVTPQNSQSSNGKTAADTVREFYKFFFASANNPLADGAYKDNKYLSGAFKEDIKALYKNGNTPVFCPQNQRANIVVGQEKYVFYENAYYTQLVISEAPPGKKDLYRVLLENLTGDWKITDINCIR